MPIRIAADGVSVDVSSEEEASIRRDFARDLYVRLPGILAPSLLRDVQDRMERFGFTSGIVNGIAHEGTSLDPMSGLLVMLANDRALFSWVERVTGCAKIGHFRGRVYRLTSGRDDYDTWHDDSADGRQIALSVNLGAEPYVGGTLQFRSRYPNATVREVVNTVPGDALMFRVANDLEHRVTPVEGAAPKTAFAGWFTSGRSILDVLAANAAKHPRRAT